MPEKHIAMLALGLLSPEAAAEVIKDFLSANFENTGRAGIDEFVVGEHRITISDTSDE